MDFSKIHLLQVDQIPQNLQEFISTTTNTGITTLYVNCQ